MAIGISQTHNWLLGDVVPPTYLQNVQDNANYSYTGTGASGVPLYYWIPAIAMTPSGGFTTQFGTGVTFQRKATNASDALVATLAFAGNGDTAFQQITEIVTVVAPASTGVMTSTVQKVSTMTTSPAASQPGFVSSSGAGFQLLTHNTTSLNLNNSGTVCLMVQIVAGNVNDLVYAVRFKIG